MAAFELADFRFKGLWLSLVEMAVCCYCASQTGLQASPRGTVERYYRTELLHLNRDITLLESNGNVERDPHTEEVLALELEAHLAKFKPILLLSPPRGNSSVFATALGRSSALKRYIHEPCGRYSYEGLSISSVTEALADLETGTLIKEMTFQMRDSRVARAILKHSGRPIVFLVRSPLLTIESRIRLVLTDLKRSKGLSASDKERIEGAIASRDFSELDDLVTEEVFPLFRTGWEDLQAQLRFCREEKIAHVVVETSGFRENPRQVLGELCSRLGLEMEPAMFTWEAKSNKLPGALDDQKAWYERVTTSTGIQPPDKKTPRAEDLPARFRAHLPVAMAVYEDALSDSTVVI